VLVGSILADKQNIKVGDTLTFVVANYTSQAKVVGITGELLDDSVLMTIGAATNLLYIDGTVNAVIMDMGSLSQSQIESVVRSNFNAATFVFTTDVLTGITALLNGITALMSIFILFGVVAEVLFISSTVVLNVIERDSEFISLRAMGADPNKILRMVINESLILLVPSLIIGLIFGVFATQWITAAIVKDLMYYNIMVGPLTYILTTLIATVSVYLAAYISARHITKLKLVDVIRQRMLT
jgi:putative ABC transport system permease protein